VNDVPTNQWFDLLFRAPAMSRVFSDRGRLQGILDFEAALARAQARAGLIPAAAAQTICGCCRAEDYDLAALAQASVAAGNSAIPVVAALTRQVATSDEAAAYHVHTGATSQDAMDTGLVLQMRQALELLATDCHGLGEQLAQLAAEHRATPLAGRTWLQHAAPTTFGLKVAGWLSALDRCAGRLADLRPRVLVLQFGGATGTLAALGDRAAQVTSLLAEELGLQVPDLPWHAQRDRLAEVAAALGLLVGTLGKMARDLALLAQTEIAEVAELPPAGGGGSTSMPQKSNPVGCAAILATATRVPALVSIMFSTLPQEHERALGGWQAEWETLPEIFLLASGALAHARRIIGSLRVDPHRLRANLEASRGLIYAQTVADALARSLGHAAAHDLVRRASHQAARQERHLRDVLLEDQQCAAYLSPAEWEQLFDPRGHVDAAARLVDQALAAHQARAAAVGKAAP
jgi:3-carboxy-cis,cis-muconate cycloisomerase